MDLRGTDVAAVETLWYDLRRWPAFVDGFGHLASVEGEWPEAGARLVWDSRPGGRGRVVARVVAFEPGAGQRLEVEDEQLTGEESVRFEPRDDGVALGLALRYELERGGPLRALTDLLFIRRALATSLQRTITRFARELEADAELSGEPGSTPLR